MSIASVVTRGYGAGINFLPPRGYLAGITPSPTPAPDTHDPYIKKHRINLPIYIKTKRAVEFRQAIKELPKELPKEIKKAITPELIQYDIDWLALSGYIRETGESLDAVMRQIEVARMTFEKEREEEEDFLFLATVASKL